jgi:hypothetical protein
LPLIQGKGLAPTYFYLQNWSTEFLKYWNLVISRTLGEHLFLSRLCLILESEHLRHLEFTLLILDKMMATR